MGTLDQWEAEAKQIRAIHGQTGTEIYLKDRLAEADTRIISLCDLIRKKDEALKYYAESNVMIVSGDNILGQHSQSKAREALALTEQLGAAPGAAQMSRLDEIKKLMAPSKWKYMSLKEDIVTEEELKEIERRTNAATPGPWEICGSGYGDYPADGIQSTGKKDSYGNPEEIIGYSIPYEQTGVNSNEDALFIAHAREDIPLLVAEVRRLQTLLDEHYFLGAIQSLESKLAVAKEALESITTGRVWNLGHSDADHMREEILNHYMQKVIEKAREALKVICESDRLGTTIGERIFTEMSLKSALKQCGKEENSESKDSPSD